mmetsp:Transcript_54333/g.129468  ORF Transcript_54333/g.129468 Transcript_54333/m.129468 type:complete len:270 (+) Transcript_54333:68-877(+)
MISFWFSLLTAAWSCALTFSGSFAPAAEPPAAAASHSARRLQTIDDGETLLLTQMMLSAADAVFLVITAFFYHRGITSQRTALQPSVAEKDEVAIKQARHHGFRTPPFACCENMDYCLYALCCPIPRIADTMHTAGVWNWNYWNVIIVALVADVCGVLGVSPVAPRLWAIPVFLIVMRPRVRAGLGLDDTTNGCDVLMSLFCTFCAVVQEAKEVDTVTNSRVACFLRLIKDDTGMAPLVGAAVEVDMRPPQDDVASLKEDQEDSTSESQ